MKKLLLCMLVLAVGCEQDKPIPQVQVIEGDKHVGRITVHHVGDFPTRQRTTMYGACL